MKKILICTVIALCIICTAVLTGCSGNKGNTAESSQETSAAQTTEGTIPSETEAMSTQKQTQTPADSNQSPLIGKWEYEDMGGFIYTFNEDGTGSYEVMGEVMKFTYTDNGGSVDLMYEDDVPSTCEYSIDGNTLIIKDITGSDVKYIKK